jgi:hypothetical protein
MKKWILVLLTVAIILVVLGGILFLLRGQEDTWIKDSRGVWVKHGNPKNTPQDVKNQQDLIQKARLLFDETKNNGADLTAGPCLGKINNDWVVDVAHNPRQAIDNLPENQCADYREGKVKHFIELDLNGEVVKVY